MAIVQLRVNDDLKEEATKVFNNLGIDLSTAIRMFLKRSVLVQGIPFPTIYEDKIMGTTDGSFTNKTQEIKELLQKIKDLESEEALAIIHHFQEISKENGNSKMSIDEINEIIRLAREERRAKDDLLRDDRHYHHRLIINISKFKSSPNRSNGTRWSNLSSY